jgi:hypothetical protein
MKKLRLTKQQLEVYKKLSPLARIFYLAELKEKLRLKLQLEDEEIELEWADDAEDSSYGDMVPDILREDEEEDE